MMKSLIHVIVGLKQLLWVIFHVLCKAIEVKPITDAFYPWDEALNDIWFRFKFLCYNICLRSIS